MYSIYLYLYRSSASFLEIQMKKNTKGLHSVNAVQITFFFLFFFFTSNHQTFTILTKKLNKTQHPCLHKRSRKARLSQDFKWSSVTAMSSDSGRYLNVKSAKCCFVRPALNVSPGSDNRTGPAAVTRPPPTFQITL